jgi:hypothetical protein
MHVREQILAAVVTTLTGLVTTGANVTRRRTIPQGIVPALNIYWSDDTPDYEAGKMGCAPMQILAVHVEGFTKGEAETQANLISSEIEVALFANPTLSGIAKFMERGPVEILVEGEGEAQVLVMDMTVNVTYRSAEGAPDTVV